MKQHCKSIMPDLDTFDLTINISDAVDSLNRAIEFYKKYEKYKNDNGTESEASKKVLNDLLHTTIVMLGDAVKKDKNLTIAYEFLGNIFAYSPQDILDHNNTLAPGFDRVYEACKCYLSAAGSNPERQSYYLIIASKMISRKCSDIKNDPEAKLPDDYITFFSRLVIRNHELGYLTRKRFRLGKLEHALSVVEDFLEVVRESADVDLSSVIPACTLKEESKNE